MYNEYDIVILKKPIKARKLEVGIRGTIIFVYHEPDLPEAYEVEFFDENGNTLDIVTVEKEYLEKE